MTRKHYFITLNLISSLALCCILEVITQGDFQFTQRIDIMDQQNFLIKENIKIVALGT